MRSSPSLAYPASGYYGRPTPTLGNSYAPYAPYSFGSIPGGSRLPPSAATSMMPYMAGSGLGPLRRPYPPRFGDDDEDDEEDEDDEDEYEDEDDDGDPGEEDDEDEDEDEGGEEDEKDEEEYEHEDDEDEDDETEADGMDERRASRRPRERGNDHRESSAELAPSRPASTSERSPADEIAIGSTSKLKLGLGLGLKQAKPTSIVLAFLT